MGSGSVARKPFDQSDLAYSSGLSSPNKSDDVKSTAPGLFDSFNMEEDPTVKGSTKSTKPKATYGGGRKSKTTRKSAKAEVKPTKLSETLLVTDYIKFEEDTELQEYYVAV